jgi:hypothetical protein
MPAFMKLGDIKGESSDSYLGLARDAAVLPYPGAAGLVGAARKAHPAGVDAILIGLMPVPGYKLTKGRNGIIAILIGLLQPAVQKMSEPNSSELMLLKSALKPGGSIGFAMADGSVRPAAGSLGAQGRPLSFQELSGIGMEVT